MLIFRAISGSFTLAVARRRAPAFRAIAAALVLGALLVVAGHGEGVADTGPAASASLAGQLLVASPKMGDPRFAGTVVFVIASDRDGAMGLVVNRAYGKGPLSALLAGFGIKAAAGRDPVRLHYGGPVDGGRGYVLHSGEYQGKSTRPVAGGLALSTGRDVLEAVAAGKGPKCRLFALGYAGWGPGQVEDELNRGDWLTAPADPALVFADDPDHVWERAMRLAGLAM
jgi:putative transcriptional regulator